MTLKDIRKALNDLQSLDDKLMYVLEQYRQTYYSSHIADFWLEKILHLCITKERNNYASLKSMMLRKGWITERSQGQWSITI